MNLHKEISFEDEICEVLAARGWLSSPSDARYDRARALFPEDVLARVQETQPKAWEAVVKNHGASVGETLLSGLRDSINQRGTLDVLRHGVEMLGMRSKLALAQFKPALAMNPEIMSRYAANRLRVMRQVHYSTHNENCIDLMLFLNGMPVATVELKTDFTQSIADVIDQYRFDRQPKPKGDRNVIDSQLQEAIFDFERTTGVVATIKGEGGRKSAELAAALSGDKKIVVCTIQTFPHALKAVRELAATQGKRFAVIADEAHSSQTGEAASKLKAVLSAEELKELNDGGEISMDDVLAANMSARADDAGVTFVAFTATPKTKTLELFGTRPDPTRKPAKDNVPRPFHVYSMRQAIEEGFIVDVLQNYTTYKLAFKLAHNGKELDDKEVERSAAMKGIMGWVRLHPYNIAQKVEIVVEHFRQHVAPLLGGKAKAMVVVASRQEAVRWQLAIEKYIKSQGYPIRTLVAFSGEVNDPESGPDPFSENSSALNPNLKGRDIREAFNTDEYQILLVANKFQTGFDQPLLCGMYVDKRLAGILAVQTLSRLNRAYPGKDTTFVLDFVNEAADVLEAFKAYHTTAELADVTDPNLVYNLRAKLDAAGYYDDFEVDRVVAIELKPNAKQSELAAAVEPIVDRLHRKYKAAQEALAATKAQSDKSAAKAAQDELNALLLFQSDMRAFQRLYTYLSQIFDYGNTEIEKRSIFYRQVLRLLEFGRERDGIDLSKVALTHHTLKNQGQQAMPLSTGEKPKLPPLTEVGSGMVREKQTAYLSEIIVKVNELFEGDLTDQDKLIYVNNVIKGKLLESEILIAQATNNTKEQFANSPDLKTELLNAVIAALDAHSAMSEQALKSEAVREGVKDILLGPGGLYESLRDEGLLS